MGRLRKEGKTEEGDKWTKKAADKEKWKGITAGVVQREQRGRIQN